MSVFAALLLSAVCLSQPAVKAPAIKPAVQTSPAVNADLSVFRPGPVLLFSKDGFPVLSAFPSGRDLVFQVLDPEGKVLAGEQQACDAAKLLFENPSKVLSCVPRELISKYRLSKAPTWSFMCKNLKAGLRIVRSKAATEFVLLIAGGEQPLFEAPIPRGHAVDATVAWDEACNLAIFVKGEVPEERLFRLFPAKTVGKVIADEARGRFWLETAVRLRAQGDLEAAVRGASTASPLLRSAADLKELALLQARLSQFRDALAAARRLAAVDPGQGAALAAQKLMIEARMETMDLAGEDFRFSAPSGIEGTSVWLKVKDKDGKNVAMFKPTNGNTYHRGEVFTYRMAKLLGIEELYPVTVLKTLDKKACEKLRDCLAATRYSGMKERNRGVIMDRCAKGELEGAVKEWVGDFQFFGAIGKLEKLKRAPILKYLRADGPVPDRKAFTEINQETRYYKPDNCKLGKYKGRLSTELLARDLSDVLVMDALNSNEDRFPGANIEFRSLGTAKEIKTCSFDLGESRLFSLDNGATFKGGAARPFGDLSKVLKVSRFNKRTWQRLERLSEFIQGRRPAPTFLKQRGITTKAQLSAYVALDKGDSHRNRKNPFQLFERNLEQLVKYLERCSQAKGAFF